jgi:DNA repair exonuclease SbcCD ATPase subunit
MTGINLGGGPASSSQGSANDLLMLLKVIGDPKESEQRINDLVLAEEKAVKAQSDAQAMLEIAQKERAEADKVLATLQQEKQQHEQNVQMLTERTGIEELRLKQWQDRLRQAETDLAARVSDFAATYNRRKQELDAQQSMVASTSAQLREKQSELDRLKSMFELKMRKMAEADAITAA